MALTNKEKKKLSRRLLEIQSFQENLRKAMLFLGGMCIVGDICFLLFYDMLMRIINRKIIVVQNNPTIGNAQIGLAFVFAILGGILITLGCIKGERKIPND